MSTTTNLIAATTLTAAAFVTGALLIPTEGDVAPEAGVVDAGQQGPLVGAFYLRFPDQAAWQAAVRSSPFWSWEQAMVDGGPDAGMVPVTLDAGTLAMSGMGHAIDVVGTITKPVGDGGVEVLDGYHVNFQGVLPEAWKQYLVQPNNPVRTWAR